MWEHQQPARASGTAQKTASTPLNKVPILQRPKNIPKALWKKLDIATRQKLITADDETE